MLNNSDLHWIAGLIEGEGSFVYTIPTPTLQLQMTDEDVVRRAATILGARFRGPYKRANCKPTWTCRLHGNMAIGWMMTLLSLMGERRQSQILKVINIWKNYTPKPRPKGFSGIPFKKPVGVPTCHPDKRVIGWGLCGVCYMREWRARQREQIEAVA